MQKFINKNELVLLFLIMLLFELNSFCSVSLSHIIYENKRKWAILIIGSISYMYMLYIYHVVCNMVPLTSVKYDVDTSKKVTECADYVSNTINDINHTENELKNICSLPRDNDGILISEKFIMLFITLILIMVTIVALSRDGKGINTTWTKLLCASPIIIMSMIVGFFGLTM